MKLIVNPKNKKQEKAVKDFLKGTAIDFTIAEEDTVRYKTVPKKTHSKKEKKTLAGLEQSVDFVNKYKKGKARAKSLKQLKKIFSFSPFMINLLQPVFLMLILRKG